MATKHYNNYAAGRRACTEMPNDHTEAFDLNALPDEDPHI